jgi:hypothetical protein
MIEGSMQEEFKLIVSQNTLAILEQMSKDTNQSLVQVLGKAIGLYQFIIDADKAGKYVGTTLNDECLETVFTGIRNV